jgi:hypothetical protein
MLVTRDALDLIRQRSAGSSAAAPAAPPSQGAS